MAEVVDKIILYNFINCIAILILYSMIVSLYQKPTRSDVNRIIVRPLVIAGIVAYSDVRNRILFRMMM